MGPTSSIQRSAVTFEQLRQLTEQGSVSAIVDAIGDPKIPEKMCRLQGQAFSLYARTRFESYSAVAPYLIRLDRDTLGWIKSALWGNPWGIFVFSRSATPELIGHFQRFLIARICDAEPRFFRFYDPRILNVYLASADCLQYGFWNGIAGYGWSEGDGVAVANPPEPLSSIQPPSATEIAFSAVLIRSFEKAQLESFIGRCIAYLQRLEVPLPQHCETFLDSSIKYAGSVGITSELDVVRFILLILNWKEMRSLVAVREILNYPEISGTDKVDLLCEIAAFSDSENVGPLRQGLDSGAFAKALERVIEKHLHDPLFVKTHECRGLTLSPEDTRWRKEWTDYYKEEIGARAQVTHATVGSVCF